jgi:hypothetical protein
VISFDKRRHARWGFLCGGSVIKIQQNSLPAVPRRSHEAEIPRVENDFHDSGVN